MHRLMVTVLVLAAGGLARGDVIHLKNGSKLEGKIVSTKKDSVTIKVKHGGKMTLPRAHVARVVSAESAAAKYGDQAADTNMNDPAAIEKLALWCSERGMGDKARELTTMARGLRLESMIRRATHSKSAKTWVDIFYWARANSLADEILLWILDQGRRLDPADSALQLAYDRFRQDLADRRRKLDFLEELRKRPRYAMPSRRSLPKASLGGLTAKALAAKKAKRKPGAKQETEAFIEEARKARVKELEQRSGVIKERDAWQRHWQETHERRRAEEEERAAQEEAARWAEERAKKKANSQD